ncbi:MAG: hypothetical protein WBX01_00700 [Nitrososphaeraceae archaeon]
MNSYEICDALKISSRPTITRDIQWWKQQFVNELKYHIQDRLPMEFSRCLENNNLCLREAWRVVASSEAKGDNRTKLQALTLIEQTTSHRIELLRDIMKI